MTDKRYRIGIWVTGLYLLTLAIYVYMQRHAVLAMEPNEVGDALAGAASPLAFLWLVLGYLQQGEEWASPSFPDGLLSPLSLAQSQLG